MCVSMIGVIYAVILAIILSRSPEIIRDQRRGNLTTAIGYSLLVIPMLIFEVSYFRLDFIVCLCVCFLFHFTPFPDSISVI
jgi:uncharacterized membrane protein